MTDSPVKVFVVGDSISMHYGEYLQQYLGSGFRYARKTGEEPEWKNLDVDGIGKNGGNSEQVLRYIEAVQNSLRPDILLLNAGHHDIRRPPPDRKIKTDIEKYRDNLEKIIAQAKKITPHVVWVLTTQLDEKRHNRLNPKNIQRLEKDDKAYNQQALEIMKQNDVPVINLRTFTAGLEGDTLADHIHFTEGIRKKQATFISQWLKDYVASPRFLSSR